MADHPFGIVVPGKVHQPRVYFVGLVLCPVMDYDDIRLCGVHRYRADLVFHQAKTPNQLTPEPMKLYTEEQVREMLKSTHIHTDNDVDMIIPKFTPIELPSDDDVEKKIENSMCSLEFDTGFESGVKWMRDKIQEKITQNQ